MRGCLVLIVPFALAGTTTPVGPVGAPIQLGAMLADAAGGAAEADAGVAEATGGAALVVTDDGAIHRKLVTFGSGGAGEAEVAWRTAASKDGAYVSEVSLVVTKPVDGVEVLAPVVLPALDGATEDNPLGSVGVVVGWRKESACGGERASTTYQLDAGGGWKVL